MPKKATSKTLPAEYLRLRLDQVVMLATNRPAPTTGPVEVAEVIAAVRALALRIAREEAATDKEEREWLRRLIDTLPPRDAPARPKRS